MSQVLTNSVSCGCTHAKDSRTLELKIDPSHSSISTSRTVPDVSARSYLCELACQTTRRTNNLVQDAHQDPSLPEGYNMAHLHDADAFDAEVEQKHLAAQRRAQEARLEAEIMQLLQQQQQQQAEEVKAQAAALDAERERRRASSRRLTGTWKLTSRKRRFLLCRAEGFERDLQGLDEPTEAPAQAHAATDGRPPSLVALADSSDAGTGTEGGSRAADAQAARQPEAAAEACCTAAGETDDGTNNCAPIGTGADVPDRVLWRILEVSRTAETSSIPSTEALAQPKHRRWSHRRGNISTSHHAGPRGRGCSAE